MILRDHQTQTADGDITEKRAVWLLRAQHGFRRELLGVIERRNRDGHRGFGRPQLTARETEGLNEAVKAFVATLAAMPER